MKIKVSSSIQNDIKLIVYFLDDASDPPKKRKSSKIDSDKTSDKKHDKEHRKDKDRRKKVKKKFFI